MWNSRPPPFMEKTILNFHFDYLTTRLSLVGWLPIFHCLNVCSTLTHLPIHMPRGGDIVVDRRCGQDGQ